MTEGGRSHKTHKIQLQQFGFNNNTTVCDANTERRWKGVT